MATSKKTKKRKARTKSGGDDDDDEAVIIVKQLSKHDVLLGRGPATAQFEGNQNFRQVVYSFKKEYTLAPRDAKKVVAKKVVHFLSSLEPPGRFVKSTSVDGEFKIVADDIALEKTCQSLREKRDYIPSESQQKVLKMSENSTPIQKASSVVAKKAKKSAAASAKKKVVPHAKAKKPLKIRMKLLKKQTETQQQSPDNKVSAPRKYPAKVPRKSLLKSDEKKELISPSEQPQAAAAEAIGVPPAANKNISYGPYEDDSNGINRINDRASMIDKTAEAVSQGGKLQKIAEEGAATSSGAEYSPTTLDEKFDVVPPALTVFVSGMFSSSGLDNMGDDDSDDRPVLPFRRSVPNKKQAIVKKMMMQKDLDSMTVDMDDMDLVDPADLQHSGTSTAHGHADEDRKPAARMIPPKSSTTEGLDVLPFVEPPPLQTKNSLYLDDDDFNSDNDPPARNINGEAPPTVAVASQAAAPMAGMHDTSDVEALRSAQQSHIGIGKTSAAMAKIHMQSPPAESMKDSHMADSSRSGSPELLQTKFGSGGRQPRPHPGIGKTPATMKMINLQKSRRSDGPLLTSPETVMMDAMDEEVPPPSLQRVKHSLFIDKQNDDHEDVEAITAPVDTSIFEDTFPVTSLSGNQSKPLHSDTQAEE